LDEYQEPLSAEQFEQQQETFEEGKYNMSIHYAPAPREASVVHVQTISTDVESTSPR
jgi:hypothetical protein